MLAQRLQIGHGEHGACYCPCLALPARDPTVEQRPARCHQRYSCTPSKKRGCGGWFQDPEHNFSHRELAISKVTKVK